MAPLLQFYSEWSVNKGESIIFYNGDATIIYIINNRQHLHKMDRYTNILKSFKHPCMAENK